MASPGRDDLPPTPPERPVPADCCHGGCDPCVFDLYREALERYETALRQWQQRHPDANPAEERK
jgi:hypothetical protein